jgi:hypothetical protein
MFSAPLSINYHSHRALFLSLSLVTPEEEPAMKLKKGDRVLVNVAPFIGSLMRCEETVACEVLDVNGPQVFVRSEPPCRAVSLWVLSHWVEGGQRQKPDALASLGMAD